MDQRIPQPIRGTLLEYLSLADGQVPGLIAGLYIEGSIALGGFNERFSDIDFVVLLSRRPNAAEFATLRDIHKVISKNYPQWKMSGSYLQSDDLSQAKNRAEAIICY